MHWFRQNAPPHDIYTAVGELSTVVNGTIERWPRILGALFGQAGLDPGAAFETWERAQDIDKRRRGSFVWSSMLAFIVAYWTLDAGLLEEMGLFLFETVKSEIDDIRYWCDIGGNIGRISGAAKEIFVKAVMDPDPSPHTNPILWWLFVIIDSQPELPIGGLDSQFVPDLSLDGQLEALNHYARVLTLELPLQDWQPSKISKPVLVDESLRTKDGILTFIHSNGNHWIDEDDNRALRRLLYERFDMDSPAWQDIRELFHSLVYAWLVHDSYGPVREILGLLNGVAANREQLQALVLSGTQSTSSSQVDQYRVIVQRWDVYTARHGKKTGRPVASIPHTQGVYPSAVEANKEARKAIATVFGLRSYAKRWDELLRDDGTVWIRAVYVDLEHNGKIIAWVEKQRA